MMQLLLVYTLHVLWPSLHSIEDTCVVVVISLFAIHELSVDCLLALTWVSPFPLPTSLSLILFQLTSMTAVCSGTETQKQQSSLRTQI